MARISGSTIKAIVFDWDGVIVDSMPTIARGIQDTAASYGVHLSVPEIFATYFQPRHAFYKSIGIEPKNEEEINARHFANIAKHSIGPRLFNDVLPTLSQLKAKGIKLGVATNAEEPRIQNEINILELRNFFALENVQRGQNQKEEKVAALIEKFGIAPSELLFVGDLPSDIIVAKKVGAKSAGICRYESGKARLKAVNPDYFLDSLSDLLTML